MRYIFIALPPNLPNPWYTHSSDQSAELATKTSAAERAQHFKKNGIWGELKQWLAATSHQKCWYCEAKSFRAPCEVDHFRPKLGTTSSRIRVVGHEGYYWLAYNWTNFRLSCIRCNRKEKDESRILHGKGNDFAVQDETRRCLNEAGNIQDETPTLLDPCCRDDTTLLANCIDGEVKPAARPGTWEYERARYTIDILGFNSYEVPEQKRKQLNLLSTLIDAASPLLIPTIQSHLKDHMADDHEYSSFYRSAIGAYRDKKWIEELFV